MRPTRRWLPLIALLAGSCHDDETAIVVEVLPGQVDVSALDDVVIRVSGPGLEGERLARATLHGEQARPFPLTLVIRGDAGQDGPFTLGAEAHGGGAVKAAASAPTPVSFEAGRVVRRELVLALIGAAGGADASAPPPSTMVDGSADAGSPAEAGPAAPTGGSMGSPGTGGATGTGGAPETGGEPATGGAPGTGGATGTGGAPGTGGAGPAASCESCDPACVLADVPAGVCLRAPEGTPCHGNSGMECRQCQCVKSDAKK
jgi:hypothetical protein